MSKTLDYPKFDSATTFRENFCRKFLVEYCVKNQKFSLNEEYNKKNAPFLSFLVGNMLGVGCEEQNLYSYLHYLYNYQDDDKLGHYLAFKANYSTCSALFRKEVLDQLVELFKEVKESLEEEGSVLVDKTVDELLKEYGLSLKSARGSLLYSELNDEELLKSKATNVDYFHHSGNYPLNYFVEANPSKRELMTGEDLFKEVEEEIEEDPSLFITVPEMRKLLKDKYKVEISKEEIVRLIRDHEASATANISRVEIGYNESSGVLLFKGEYAANKIIKLLRKNENL